MPQQATFRECPYCGEEKESQGLYAHVMNSDDDVHGSHGSVPEGFEPLKAPIVTEDEEVVEVDLEEKYPNELYMCHHCGTMCKGRRGISIHLSKSAGDELHPSGASIANENYTVIPADDEWNPMVDQSELAELHGEITANIHELSLYRPEGGDVRQPSHEELQELVDQAVIPHDQSKVEQVATLLNQVPELYDQREFIKNFINCSTTTYYEGRKMYDNNAAPGMEQVSDDRVDRVDQITWQGNDESVVIDGEHYVPISSIKNMVRKLNEITNEGAKIIHRNQ